MPSNEIVAHVASPMTVTFSEMERLAESVAKTGMFGGIRTKDQALTLMMISQAEGKHPALAARDYDIIQNRPAKRSEAMLRDFFTGGGRVEWHELTDEVAEATFSHAIGGTMRIRWDQARVKQAALAGRDMHIKYPRQMLRSRCVAEGVRTVWPMATGGLMVPEEAVETREPIDITPPAAPVDTAADLDVFAADALAVDEGALTLTAETAAMKGREMFRAFWGPLSALERDMLRPDLHRYQAVAAAADDERARDNDPFGLPPLPTAAPAGSERVVTSTGDSRIPSDTGEAEAPAVPFGAAVRALVPVAGDDGEPNWRAWSEAFVGLVERASSAECEKLRISSLPAYGRCRTEYGDGARAIVDALAAKAKAAEPAT